MRQTKIVLLETAAIACGVVSALACGIAFLPAVLHTATKNVALACLERARTMPVAAAK